jgi:hypothetical protein
LLPRAVSYHVGTEISGLLHAFALTGVQT